MTSSVDGWIVSPRKSRRKSACFSRTRTAIPARANNNASIIPAGPPPTMQHRTETSRTPIGSPLPRQRSSASSAHHADWPRRRKGSSALHRRWRREMQDLLERFQLFEPRGLSCRDIVAISGPVGLGDGGLGRNNRSEEHTSELQSPC